MKISKNAENCLLKLDPQVLTDYVNEMAMTVGKWGGRYVKWIQGEQEHLFSLKYLLKIIETKKQSPHLGQIIQSFKKLNLKGENELKKAFWWKRLLTWLRRINLLGYSWKKEVTHIEKSIVSTNPLPPQNNKPTPFHPISTNPTKDKKKQQTTAENPLRGRIARQEFEKLNRKIQKELQQGILEISVTEEGYLKQIKEQLELINVSDGKFLKIFSKKSKADLRQFIVDYQILRDKCEEISGELESITAPYSTDRISTE